MTNGEALYKVEAGLAMIAIELDELRAQVREHTMAMEKKRREQKKRDENKRLCRESLLIDGGQMQSIDSPPPSRRGGGKCGGCICPGPVVNRIVE